MRARYMDPVLGRFISEDPAKDGQNWFVYCDNNPVNLQDRNGKDPIPIFGTTQAALIAGFLFATDAWVIALYGWAWTAAGGTALLVQLPTGFQTIAISFAILSVAAFQFAFLGQSSLDMGASLIELDTAISLITVCLGWLQSAKLLTILGPTSFAVGTAFAYGLETIGALEACDDAFVNGV